MSATEIENYERFNKNRLDIIDPPSPEPIYDLTTSDKTELVKLQGQLREEKILSLYKYGGKM